MKKLLIIACVAFAACASQAAQFRWAFTAAKAAASDYDGSTVYMVLAADYAAATISTLSDITSIAKSSGTLTVGSMTATTGNVTVNDSWVTEGTTYSWYAIVVNDDKYYVSSSASSSTAVGDTATPANVSFASKSEMATASNWTTFSGSAVPEPTSGLLMLLGMAGLALRRRRA